MSKRQKLTDSELIKLHLKFKQNKDHNLSKIANSKEIVNQFIDLFVVCESTIKLILKEYYKANNQQISDKYTKLNLNSIKPALNYFAYNYDEDTISHLFGSNSKKGEKSLKILRNEILHGANTSAIDELTTRQN